MPQIIIQDTVIDFPDSSQSPNWAEGIIKFAETVEMALSAVVNTGDVSPQIFVIDAYNAPADVVIPNLAFSTTTVRSAEIRYSVYRTTSLTHAIETGVIQVVYDNSTSSWILSRERTGDGQISFDITTSGQVRFNPTALAGTGHTGTLVFAASTLQQ
jgi:hypothetical protein